MDGSLAKNLKLYNIPHSYMYNAGTDTYYTLQMLMKIGNYKFRQRNQLDNLKHMSLKIKDAQMRDNDAMLKCVITMLCSNA